MLSVAEPRYELCSAQVTLTVCAVEAFIALWTGGAIVLHNGLLD